MLRPVLLRIFAGSSSCLRSSTVYHYRAQRLSRSILITHNAHDYDNRPCDGLHVQLTGIRVANSFLPGGWQKGAERGKRKGRERERGGGGRRVRCTARSQFSRFVSHGFIDRPILSKKRKKRRKKEKEGKRASRAFLCGT